jgi:gliding motility-associated-like protein
MYWVQRFFTKYIFCFLLISSQISFVFSQPANISGIVNLYKKVINISTDTAFLNNTTGLNADDMVMIMQVTGAELDLSGASVIQDLNNTGRFEILKILSVEPGNKIVFESAVAKNYDIGEAIQLIRIPEYEKAVVTGTLTCRAWDGDTGGVLAIIANQSLILQADIDVSGKGFRGGSAADLEEYTGGCSDANDSAYYHKNTLNQAAFKGEGFVQKNSPYTRGYGANANGGGGGNGRFFGGAGGANVVEAGQGGYEMESCPGTNTFLSAEGGQFYLKVSEFYNFPGQRITLGGGGGTATQNIAEGFLATSGGNGGGIVLIIADSIKGNGHAIKANGQSVSTVATAGGGGGGGGGAIMLEVKNFIDHELVMQANGGNGGNTSNDLMRIGPGGAGGKGIIWYSINSLPSNIVNTLECIPGEPGTTSIFHPFNYGAIEADDSLDGFAHINNNMVLPLTGFLFNTVYDDQEICHGEVPSPLRATSPKGGDGKYTYQWQSRTQSTTWANIGVAGDSMVYTPIAPHTDTTFYRRIVTSENGAITDISKVVTVFVHDKITGNFIEDDQLMCNNEAPNPLTGSGFSGGTHIDYAFSWEKSLDGTNFEIIAGASNASYAPGALTDSTYFRRRIVSGACESMSDTVLVQVLDPISGNTIGSDQDLCFNLIPEPLTGGMPTGGDGSNYAFTWEQSPDNINWTDAPGDNAQAGYTPGSLTQDTYYRRIVASGQNGSCIHASGAVKIDVLPSIQNNNISKNDTACHGDRINLIGAQPTQGNGTYSFEWISGNNLSGWATADAFASSINAFTSKELDGDIYFKRVVRSGKNNACIDSSEQVYIRVWDAISGNSIAGGQHLCFGETPDNIQGSTNLAGGDASFSYQWQVKEKGGNFEALPGDNQQTDYIFGYTPVPNTYFIRRKVISDVCTDFSDSVKLEVLPQINGNEISNKPDVCFNSPPQAFGSDALSGGSGNYTYAWLVSTDSANFNPAPGLADVAQYQPNPLSQKSYFLRIVESGACTDTSNIFPIGILPLPTATVLANSDTVCQGTAVTIHMEATGNGPWEISFTDENSAPQKSTITSGDLSLVINPQSSFVFEADSVRDNKGCYASDISGSTQVNVYAAPPANAGNNMEVCGNIVKLSGSEGFVSRWEYDGTTLDLENENLPNTTAESQVFGQQQLVYHVFDWECESTDTLQIFFYEQPDEAAFVNNPIDLNFQFTVNLNAIEPSVGKGLWSLQPSDSGKIKVENPGDPKSEVSLPGSGEFYFYWTISNGVCEPSRDSLLVSVTKDVPQGFSPNGDNVNDFFVVGGEGTKKLKIVNRWGQEVYYEPDYQNDWDGTASNGEQLPDGTYFYILIFENTEVNLPTETGYVIIKR